MSRRSAALQRTGFARLDERTNVMTERLFDDGRPEDEDDSIEEADDGLDVWSLLDGLK